MLLVVFLVLVVRSNGQKVFESSTDCYPVEDGSGLAVYGTSQCALSCVTNSQCQGFQLNPREPDGFFCHLFNEVSSQQLTGDTNCLRFQIKKGIDTARPATSMISTTTIDSKTTITSSVRNESPISTARTTATPTTSTTSIPTAEAPTTSATSSTTEAEATSMTSTESTTTGSTTAKPEPKPAKSCAHPGDNICDCYDCAIYWNCDVKNVPQKRNCISGHFYTGNSQDCDRQDKVNCTNGKRPDRPETQSC